MEVTLLDYQKRTVGKTQILGFVSEPDVLTWEYRTFRKISERTYQECFNARIPCEWVPICLRVGDPATIIKKLAVKGYEALNNSGAIMKWESLSESDRLEYRRMATAVFDEAVKAFSAEWSRGADGSTLLQFNQAATKE